MLHARAFPHATIPARYAPAAVCLLLAVAPLLKAQDDRPLSFESCRELAQRSASRGEAEHCYRDLSQAHAAAGRFEDALAAFQAYEKLEHERFDAERRRTLTRRGLVVGFSLSLALLLLIYSRYRLSAHTSRTIEQKNRELERALNELRESEKRYRRLFKDPSIGKLVIDPIEETILDANLPARVLLGRPHDDLTDVSISELSSPWLARMMHRPPSQGSDSRAIVEAFEHVDAGLRRFYEAWVSPLHLSGVPMALVTLHDVTERRALQEERVRQEERERYIEELEAKKAEVEARNAEMERFTYTVSHDLKSPLFTIRGFLGFLAKDMARGDGRRVEEDIGHINTAVLRMGRFLDELLELSRVGRVANPSQEVSVAELAEQATQALSGRLDERGVVVDVDATMPTAYGDRERLGEVLQNLIENAVKFLGDQAEPRVEVSWRREGGEVVFFVRDNGIGIEARYQDRVFGLFDRLDSAVDGSGVGLALVKRIVEVHGGRIWIKSDGAGCGSTFCFTLPAPSFGTEA